MSHVGYSFVYKILSCFFLGIVIRILDDHIDDDTNNYEVFNLSIRNSKGLLPYGLIFFAISSGFHNEYAVTLLSSCYIIGMFHDINVLLPTTLKSYQESIIIILINIFLFGFLSLITSLLIVFLIQLIDDVKDMQWDKKYGFKNFANIIGKFEAMLLSLIVFIGLGVIDFEKLIIVLTSYIVVDFIFRKKSKARVA